MDSDYNIDGRPSKSFFIDMLTKDITLTDCIMDLIDNSVDSILTNTDVDVSRFINNIEADFSEYCIEIELDKKHFLIKDNCFGIDSITAKQYAFKFGRGPEDKRKKSGLSVYGIGMKRAFFKIGKQIMLKSQSRLENILIEIDVNEWEKDEKVWDFHFSQIEKKVNVKTGTEIIITNLNADISKALNDQVYINKLRNKVNKTFLFYLNLGLKIKINGKTLTSSLPTFQENSDEIYTSYLEDTYQKDGTDIIITALAGITSFNNSKNLQSGWFVFCNGRLVLEGNQDTRTGWGLGLPKFHSKFNHFLGYLFFYSTDIQKLPWTTTKENIEFDSQIYQYTLGKIKNLTRPYVKFLNDMYPSDPIPIEDSFEKQIVNSSQPKLFTDIEPKSRSFIPPKPPAKAKVTLKNISYKVEPEKFLAVKKKLRVYTNKDVGLKTFNYFYSMECDDE